MGNLLFRCFDFFFSIRFKQSTELFEFIFTLLNYVQLLKVTAAHTVSVSLSWPSQHRPVLQAAKPNLPIFSVALPPLSRLQYGLFYTSLIQERYR